MGSILSSFPSFKKYVGHLLDFCIKEPVFRKLTWMISGFPVGSLKSQKVSLVDQELNQDQNPLKGTVDEIFCNFACPIHIYTIMR